MNAHPNFRPDRPLLAHPLGRRRFLGTAVAAGIAASGVAAACGVDSREPAAQPSPGAGGRPAAPDAATLVLVHGAWHRSEPTWGIVQRRLDDRGIRSVAVDLPSTEPGSGGTLPGLAEDAAAVRATIDRLDGPVVLVGHSYGGMVISEAGRHPAVTSLVYLAAFCTTEDESVLTIAAVDPPPLIAFAIRYPGDGTMEIDRALAREVFYADVDDELATRSVEQLVPSTAAVFDTTIERPAWRDTRSLYVVCTQDQAIPVFREQEMAARCTDTIELDSSHSPFLSMPDTTADLLEEEARL